MLKLVHGWGFDARLWDTLGLRDARAADRGYFGRERILADDGIPHIAVGHSLGALLLLRYPPKNCIGLVAINGFDRFGGEAGDCTAVPRRVVERMIARFRNQPEQVLGDFRKRCGSDDLLPGVPQTSRLLADLELLRDADERDSAVSLSIPVLVLHGGEDGILPPEMRASTFAATTNAERHELTSHGHLLPLTAPDWCVGHIRAFAGRLGVTV